MLFDDLTGNGPALFRDLFASLASTTTFHLEEVQRYNSSGTAKNAALERALSTAQMLKGVARAVLPEVAVRRLIGSPAPRAQRQSRENLGAAAARRALTATATRSRAATPRRRP